MTGGQVNLFGNKQITIKHAVAQGPHSSMALKMAVLVWLNIPDICV